MRHDLLTVIVSGCLVARDVASEVIGRRHLESCRKVQTSCRVVIDNG